jgi:hypothetical protein
VGFVRFLNQSQLSTLFNVKNVSVCRDVFIRAGQTVLPKGCEPVCGWFVLVRGSLVHGSPPDEVVVPCGSTMGMVEAMLNLPVAHTFTAVTFTHLLYFDKAALLELAMQPDNVALLRSIWWYVGIHELRRTPQYEHMDPVELGALLITSRFLHCHKAIKRVVTKMTSGSGDEELQQHTTRAVAGDGSMDLLVLSGGPRAV